MIDLSFMELCNFGVQALNNILLQLVGTERDTEFILCAVNDSLEGTLDIILNVVHAEVQVFDLRVLDSNPLFNLLSLLVDSLDWLDVIELWNWLLRLLLRLKFLIFLNNSITGFEILQVVLNIVGWEWESSNQIEKWKNHFCAQVQLAKSEVLNASVTIHDISQCIQ